MERRNKVQFPGALPYVGEADGCGCISKEMGFRKVQTRSPEDSINDCFSPSALCLDFPLFEGKLFLRLSKEEWDDNGLFLHCFTHYLVLVSATAVLIHDFSDYFSCLLDAISACFFVLCLGQFVLNPSFPQNSGSSWAELSSSWLHSPVFPARLWRYRGVVIRIPSSKQEGQLDYICRAGVGGSFRYTLRVNSSRYRGPCSQILWC